MALRLFGGVISVSHLNDEGSAMPAFMFEKIPPPVGRTPASPAANEKPRGTVAQMLERFVEMRIRRKSKAGTAASERRELPHEDI